jgi:multidrug efflux system membrane fusion protein
MLSGLFDDDNSEAAAAAENGTAPLLTRVEVRTFHAEPMQQAITVYGQSEARRQVVVKAEVAGQVAAVLMTHGEAVRADEVMLRLGEEDRPQRLEQARAALRQRELEYQAAKSLKSKGLQAERQLAEALTLLQAARAELMRAQLNMQHLAVKAPFDGVLLRRHVEVGDYVSVGDPLAQVVELDPLVVSADVAESEVGALRTGMSAGATLSNGVLLQGKITYIAAAAEASTRTYRIEMEVANPPPHQLAGMTAELRIPLGTVPAHKVSPALLSLDDAGVLGLKSVDREERVQFHPVEILKSERDGLWLGGLPETVELITVGQGFVRAGDRVEAVRAE